MMEPRVNSTVLLCFTIQRILLKIQAPSFPKQIRDVLKKIIADNIALCFKKNICNEFVQIETLYLLTILESFGKDYLLDQAVLKKYFGLDSTKTKITLNYLSITVLLFYIKNRRKYLSIRKILEMKICEYFGSLNEDNKNNAESIFLLIDIISCPYIEKNNKRMVLAKYLKKPDEINCLINNLSFSFTSWNSMNITKELDLKRNKSVY